MRNLTKGQKKILLDWIRTQTNLNLGFKAEDLPTKIYEQLEEINDTEVLYQNINAFVHENLDKQKRSLF